MKPSTRNISSPQKAWVVFSGHSDLYWLRLLKPGFRHCYIIIRDEHGWMSLECLATHLEITRYNLTPEFNLPCWLQTHGYITLPAPISRPPKNIQAARKFIAPTALLNCVETVKRFLGLRARFILTPWQLYKHLIKNNTPLSLHHI